MIGNRKVVNYFTYFDETCQELLILHIDVMKDAIDEFIIVESNKTHSGIPIEYHLKERIKEFGLPEEKIRVIELNIPDDDELVLKDIDYLNSTQAGENIHNPNAVRARARERMQRDALMDVIDDYDDNTVFIIGDCDEILKPEHVPSLVVNAAANPQCIIHIPLVYLQGRADYRTYYQNNEKTPWNRHLLVCLKQHFDVALPVEIRSHQVFPWEQVWLTDGGKYIDDMGWHFSWMGPKDKRIIKRDSFVHYQDQFVFNSNNSYSSETMTNRISSDPYDGMTAYSSEWEILKPYPHNELPKELFANERVRDFLLPGYKQPNYSVGMSNWQGRIHVIDNFYADPYAVRELALSQQYRENGSRGVRSLDQFIFPGVKESFEKIIGKKITNWSEYYGICGRFQYCISEDALVYHCDSQRWAAIVFLTPDAPPECGTALLRHKKTGVRTSEDPRIHEAFRNYGTNDAYFLDGTPFEEIDVVGNVFNRLVIFDGRCLHTARKYFGNTKENGRLFHIFFFDAEE